MAKHELDFTKERETKNTIRYQEDAKPGQPQVIGTLYIQKWVGVAITLPPGEKIWEQLGNNKRRIPCKTVMLDAGKS